MDTGKLVLVVLLLAIVVVAVVLLNSGDPVGTAVLQAQTGIAAAPAIVSPIAGIWSFAAHALIILVGAMILVGLIYWTFIRSQRLQEHWMREPRNRNGRWFRPHKLPSIEDVFVMDWMNKNTARPKSQDLPPAPEEY